jgi:hypothetical protein
MLQNTSVGRGGPTTGSQRALRPVGPLAHRAGGPLLPYAIVGGFALLALLPLCLRLPWAGDLGLHAAVVQRLGADLTAPGNPLVDEDTPSPYYSPWMVLLGAVARLTGWGPFAMLSIAAVTAAVLLLTGIYRFVRTLSAHRWAPALALPLVLLLWGWDLFAWSGWIELTSLALTVAYPSTLALGLSLHLWAWLRQEAREGWRPAPCLAMGTLGAAVLLIHQFTGAIAILGATAIAVSSLAPRSAPRAPHALRNLGFAVAAMAALLTAWPYYDFWRLADTGGLESIHRDLYRDLLPRYGLALIALPALAVRARRHRLLDPLVLLFLTGAAVFTAGGLLHQWSWGRIWPGVMLPAQLALAVELAALPAGRLRRTAGAAVAAALAFGAWTQLGVVSYMLPEHRQPAAIRNLRHIPSWGHYSWISRHVRYGDVIMTHDYRALRMAPAYGAYTVAPAYPDFFLPDERQRRRDTAAFFARRTSPGTDREILTRYHVAWVIDTPSDSAVTRGPLFTPVATGPGGERLFKVDRTALRAATSAQ